MIDATKPPVTPENDEIEAAARTFHLGAAEFHKRVDDLSLKSAKRIIKALVFFPLQEDNVQIVVHKDEYLVFEKGMELMEAKMKMIDWAQKTKEMANKEKEETK